MSVWKGCRGLLGWNAPQVSILVLLDVSLKESLRVGPWRNIRVSILVLLDVSLKAGHDGCNRRRYHRFQSLFFWMSVWKAIPDIWKSRVIDVSILVLLDVSLKEYPYIADCRKKYVSILVLLDVSLKGYMRFRALTCQAVSILVLLDVSLKATIPWPRRPPDESFNPCSFGCQSESRHNW